MTRPAAPEGKSGGVAVGTVLGDTYEIARLIGQGGMGAVWEARHLRLPGKKVAVKVLLAAIDPGSEAWTRFRREAEIASRLGHPNIVEVHDYNVTPEGAPYLVLELLQGQSLAGRLERGTVPVAEAIAIARQIGSALAAAHNEGVVHRDLKPENVFLTPPPDGEGPPRVKVLDFGISKITGSTTLQTQEQRILGTPQYMAPEQAKGQNSAIDARTDVWALGAICYEMLAGKPPFSGENLAEVVFKVVYEKHAPLAELAPGTPAAVVAAIDKALEKDPAARHADVASFIAALSGRPLPTLDRAPVPGQPARDPALAKTMPSGDQQVALAKTMPSGDHATPLPAPLPAPTAPTPMAVATTTSSTADVRGKGRTGLVVGLVAGAALAGGIGVFAMRGGKEETPPAAPTPPAVVAAAPPDAAPAPPPDGAVATAVPAPDAAPAVAVHTPKPPADKPPADRPPADRPPPADGDDGDDGGDGGDEPASARQYLDLAEAAMKDGNYKEAIRQARRSLIEKETPRAYAIIARAYCKLGDLGNAKAQLSKLGPKLRPRVKRFCSEAGVDLGN